MDLVILSKPRIHSKKEGKVYALHIPAKQWWDGRQTPAGDMICPPSITQLTEKVAL